MPADAIAPLGQYPVVEHQIDVRAGRDGGQPFQEFVWREDEMAGAVMPRMAERADDAAVGESGQPLLRQRRAQQVPAEPLEPEPIIGADVAIGVEIEAFEVRVPRADGPDPWGIGIAADAQHGRAGAAAERRATADGGGAELREHGRIGGERIGLDVLAV
jgi:hypothetical protein